MVLALPIVMVNHVINPCSSCTDTINNTTPELSIPKYSKGETEWTDDDLIQYTVPYKIDKAVSTKNISIVRKPVTYQTVPCHNKFNKNSAKSLRRRGALFQPGRTNCNQRTLR
jgi:hypothetical protein